MRIQMENSFKNVLYIKLWNFKRRSILKYLIASILLSLAFYVLKFKSNLLISLIFIFASLMALSLLLMILSAFLLTRKRKLTTINLENDSVEITDTLLNETLKFDWNEIIYKEDKNNFFISTIRKKKFYYWISKSKLNSQEILAIQELYKSNLGESPNIN